MPILNFSLYATVIRLVTYEDCLQTLTENYFVLYYFCTLLVLPFLYLMKIGWSYTMLGSDLCLSRSTAVGSLFTYGAFSMTLLRLLNAGGANWYWYLYYFHCCYLYAIDYLLSR